MDAQQIDITFSQLSQLSRAYGAPAVDMAERVLQRSAVGQIGTGVVLAVAAVGFFWGSGQLIRVMKKAEEERGSVGIEVFGVLGATFSGIACLGCVVAAVVMLSDIWAWTALSDPTLALGHDIFGSMGG